MQKGVGVTMEEFNFEMEDTKETKTRVKKAVEKKAKATESMEDAWERIFLMKNSATDQERLREVKEAWELGVLIRKDTSKKFSKSEAMKMYTELSEHLREQRIADMVAKTPNNYFLVRDSVQLKHVINLLRKEKLTALDTETTGLDTYRDTIVGMSITLPIADLHVYIPNGHDNQEQLSLEYVLRELDFYLTNPEYEKVLHNAKYDYHMFARHGVKLNGIVMDTMIAMKLLNENETSYRLKDLANKYATHIGVDPEEEAYTFDTLFGKNCKFNTVPLDIALVYACKDTHLTYKFYKFLRGQLDKKELEGVRSLHDTVENPLIPIVADMERVGFLPDLDYTKEYSKELHTQIDEIGKELKEVFGDINFSSPLQLQKVLYDDLGLKDSSGKRSTDKKTLESLANDNEHVAKILEHRKLNKLAGTYVDVIEGLLRPDGRVHGNFNQVEAGTGRFSSTNQNLQNLPGKARLMYVAPEGKVIVGADLSAIEPRVLAHISDDFDLRKPYLDGIDLYQTLASRTFNVPFEECGDGSKYRKMMKTGLGK